MNISEAKFQKQVTDLCDQLGLHWFHNPDSRRVNPGLPDLIIIGDGGVIYAELKSRTGTLRTEQRKVIYRLRKSGQRVHIWRPGNLTSGAIYAALLEISVRPPTNG